MAAALLRPDQVLSRVAGESCSTFATGFSKASAQIEIAPGRFRLKDYLAFLVDNEASIAAFKSRQQAAFDAERARWQETAQDGQGAAEDAAADIELAVGLPADGTAVESPVPGSVWKILVEPGREVREGDPLIIVESMKMEIEVCAPSSGRVAEVCCAEGKPVQLGQALVIMADHP